MNPQNNEQPPVQRRLFEIDGEQFVEENGIEGFETIPQNEDNDSIGSPPELVRSANTEITFHTPIPYEEHEIVISEEEPYPIVSRLVGNDMIQVQIPRTITGMGPTRVIYDEIQNHIPDNNETIHSRNQAYDEEENHPVHTITYYDCTGGSFTVNNPII